MRLLSRMRRTRTEKSDTRKNYLFRIYQLDKRDAASYLMNHLQKSQKSDKSPRRPGRRNDRKGAPDWAAIEQDYRAGVKSMARIAADHGVSQSTIARRARAAGWPSRREVRREPAPPAPERAALMARMRWLLERQIAHIERRHAAGPKADEAADATIDNAADRERNARTLGSLIRTLEKLIDLERELSKTEAEEPETHARSHDRQADEPASDTDAIRTELARRLARLAAAGSKTEISSKPDPG